MKILRKLFTGTTTPKRLQSEKNEEAKQPRDVNTLKAVGKTGLQVGGILGGAALAEGARSVYNANQVSKGIGDIQGLRHSKHMRNFIKDQIKDNTKYFPKLGDKIIDKVRWGEKNFPKFNTLDKIDRGVRYWNMTSKPSRTILDNLDNGAKMAVDSFKEKNKKKLTKEEMQMLDKIPVVAKKIGKTGTALKNAKVLGKGALIAGHLGGLLYINGRALETGAGRPVN